MKTSASLPDINTLAIISAAIILSFALTQLVSFPTQMLSFTLFGILLEFPLDFNTLITGLTALLSAAGMDWLIQSHPQRKQFGNRWVTVRHWILPVLTAIVIGVALNSFSGSPIWWIGFLLGSGILIAVFVAEYNVFASDHGTHPFARIGLTGLSFALYLLLSITLYAANIRLYLRLPLLGIGAVMVVSRTLFLQLGHWEFIWSLVISMVVTEFAVGFHYLPITALQFGLIQVGIGYGLTSVLTGIKESRKGIAFWGAPIFVLVILILISIFWG